MKKLLHLLDQRFEEYVLVASLAFTVALIFVQVVMRYIFNNSLSWSEELARYVFLWQIWLGSALAVKYKKHIRVDILLNRLSPGGQVVLNYLVYALWIFFLGVLSYQSFQVTQYQYNINQISAALHLPMWVAYASVPVGCALTIFRLLQQIWRERKNLSAQQ